MRIDRVLKALGTEMAKEEREKLPRSLPSSAFISNYLRLVISSIENVARSVFYKLSKPSTSQLSAKIYQKHSSVLKSFKIHFFRVQ